MEYYLQAFSKYAQFSGRARRKEYWMFYLFNFIFAVILLLFGNEIGLPFLYPLYALVVLLPGLAVGVRRLHDIGKSGWMMLIGLIPLIGGIILIVFMATEGDPYKNEYGEDPKMAGGY